MPSAQRIIECRRHAFSAGSGARRDSLIRCPFVDAISLTTWVALHSDAGYNRLYRK